MRSGERLSPRRFFRASSRHSLRQLSRLRAEHLRVRGSSRHLGEAGAIRPRDAPRDAEFPKRRLLSLANLSERRLFISHVANLTLQRADALQLSVHARRHRVFATRAVLVQRRHRRVGGVGGGEDGFDVFVVDGVQRRALIQNRAESRARARFRTALAQLRDGILHERANRLEVRVQALNRGRLFPETRLRALQLLLQRGDVDVRTSHEKRLDVEAKSREELLQIADFRREVLVRTATIRRPTTNLILGHAVQKSPSKGRKFLHRRGGRGRRRRGRRGRRRERRRG